ncbi:MAG: enhanced serine sensitivity protein SseB C-terminal domain-containing protein [Eubacteriales bacterium]
MSSKECEIRQLADTFLKLVDELNQNRNRDSQYNMYEVLYRLELYVPTKKSDNITKDDFYTITNEKGQQFIPAFLYEDSVLGEFKKEQLTVISYLDLKYYVIDAPEAFSGIVINPFEQNFVFDDNFIEIADSVIMGMTIKSVKHEDKMIITKPNSWNLKMINDLYKVLEEKDGVSNAWLFNSSGTNSDRPHITVLVDFDGEKVDLFPSLAEVMNKHLKPGDLFELMKKSNECDTSQLDEVKIFSRG